MSGRRECLGVCSEDAVVHRTIVEAVVPAVEGVPQRCLRLLDLLEAVVEFAQFRRCHGSPVWCGPAARADERRDLRQREASLFEQVDERDLFDGVLVVDAFATCAPGGAEQAFALIKAQGRRCQPGAGPQFGYRQLAH